MGNIGDIKESSPLYFRVNSHFWAAKTHKWAINQMSICELLNFIKSQMPLVVKFTAILCATQKKHDRSLNYDTMHSPHLGCVSLLKQFSYI